MHSDRSQPGSSICARKPSAKLNGAGAAAVVHFHGTSPDTYVDKRSRTRKGRAEKWEEASRKRK